MKKTTQLLLSLFFVIASFSSLTAQQNMAANPQTTLNLFDEVLFYDGYAAPVSQPVPAGVLRLRNDLYTRKLTTLNLNTIGTNATINVTIKASCDNYDRIGNVNMALVPKGAVSYVSADVQHIELGRFITPFMNKNVSPNEVPYTFVVDNLAKILNDTYLTSQFDFWIELQIFGVPYAAQTQVAGCAGRNDVFFGSLNIVTTGSTATPTTPTFLLPLSFQADFNNYSATATDLVGTTQKTINFTLPNDVQNAKLYLITSNHGSNDGGEEYVRRYHYVYLDGVELLNYRPGGISCEPYRMYNTQGNGIYGASPQTTSWWTAWNNWCPGNAIPIREITSLGTLAAGTHSFKITVPSAQFAGGQGNFPLSLYLQGDGQSLKVENFNHEQFAIYPNPTENIATIAYPENVKSTVVTNMIGQQVWKGNSTQIDLSGLAPNVYFATIEFENGQTTVQKIVKK